MEMYFRSPSLAEPSLVFAKGKASERRQFRATLLPLLAREEMRRAEAWENICWAAMGLSGLGALVVSLTY